MTKEEEAVKTKKYLHYTKCHVFGWIADEPEIHIGMDSDGDDNGYTVLDVMTTAAYEEERRGENGSNNTNLRVIIDSAVSSDAGSVEPYDEIQGHGYLATDAIGRMSMYLVTSTVFRNGKILFRF